MNQFFSKVLPSEGVKNVSPSVSSVVRLAIPFLLTILMLFAWSGTNNIAFATHDSTTIMEYLDTLVTDPILDDTLHVQNLFEDSLRTIPVFEDTLPVKLIMPFTIQAQTAYGHKSILALNLMGNSATAYILGPSDSVTVLTNLKALYGPGDSIAVTYWTYSDSGAVNLDLAYSTKVHPDMAASDTTHLVQDFSTESTVTTSYISFSAPTSTLIITIEGDTGNRWDTQLQIVVGGMARMPDTVLSSYAYRTTSKTPIYSKRE